MTANLPARRTTGAKRRDRDADPQAIAAPGLVRLDSVRVRLAVVWLSAASIIFGTLILQSLMGHYQDRTDEVWKWLLPAIMPTLGLVISVIGSSALLPFFSGAVVRKSFYRVALLLSIFYLLFIFLNVVIQPFVSATVDDQIKSFHTSNLWLAPLQGLVASALGVLFASKHSAQSDSQDNEG
jgi:hypothetical protein